MKRLLLLLLAVVALQHAAKAELLPYESFLKDGNTWWVWASTNGINDSYYNYLSQEPILTYFFYKITVEGDTTLNGITYKKMYLYYDSGKYEIEPHLLAFMRDNDKQVYGLQEDIYLDLEINGSVKGPYYDQTGEILLYDFEDPLKVIGSSKETNPSGFAGYRFVELEMTNGNKRTAICNGSLGICEGIGWLYGLGMSNFLDARNTATRNCVCGSQMLLMFQTADHENEYVMNNGFENEVFGYYEDYFNWLEAKRSGVEYVSAVEPAIRKVDGAIEITLPDNDAAASGVVSIISIAGKVVKTVPVTAQRTTVTTAALTAGTYIVQYKSPRRQMNRKVIVD